MFFIVNKTKNTLVLSDINITLGPRQAVDLDKMMNRKKSESSRMLKAASKKGKIDIRVKDKGKTNNVSTSKANHPDLDLDDFKKEMLEEMKGLLSQQQAPQSKQEGISKDDLSHFAQQIIQNIPKSETVINQSNKQNIREDDETDIDEDLSAKINARTVDKMLKGTKVSAMDYKENKQEKQENSILDNISELEGLIG